MRVGEQVVGLFKKRKEKERGWRAVGGGGLYQDEMKRTHKGNRTEKIINTGLYSFSIGRRRCCGAS
jgi:hypothetical protein